MIQRNSRGRLSEGPSEQMDGLPEDYAELLVAAKEPVKSAQIKAARRVSSELVLLYLRLGLLILDRQEDEGYGTKVIAHLARDLGDRLPQAARILDMGPALLP